MLQRRIKPLVWPAKLPMIRLPAPSDSLPCAPVLRPSPGPYPPTTLPSTHSPCSHPWYITHTYVSPSSAPSAFSPCRARGRDHGLQGKTEPLAGGLPWQGWITPVVTYITASRSLSPSASQTFQRWKQLKAEGYFQVISSV